MVVCRLVADPLEVIRSESRKGGRQIVNVQRIGWPDGSAGCSDGIDTGVLVKIGDLFSRDGVCLRELRSRTLSRVCLIQIEDDKLLDGTGVKENEENAQH